MLGERILIYFAFLSTVIVSMLLFQFMFHTKSWMPDVGVFTHTPVFLTKKYKTEATPGLITMALVWGSMGVGKITSLTWLIKTKERVFKKEYYIRRIIYMLLSIVWMFLYDNEINSANFWLTWIVVFVTYTNIYHVCRRLELSQSELASLGLKPFSESDAREFQRYVLTSSSIEIVWSCTALPLSISLPATYIDSRAFAEAVPRGFVSVETGSFLGIFYIIFFQMCFTALDFSAYRVYTKYLTILHPGIALMTFGSFLSNYFKSQQGLTRNTSVYFICAVFSLGAYIIQRLRSNKKENRLNGFYRDQVASKKE